MQRVLPEKNVINWELNAFVLRENHEKYPGFIFTETFVASLSIVLQPSVE